MTRRRYRGFTLIETLVTLVLVSTVAMLLWQSLGLVARWERGVLQQRLDGGEQRLRRAWVEQALWGSVAGASGDAFRFVGDERHLRTYTTAPPWPATLGPDAMELRLQDLPGGQTHIQAVRLADGRRFELWQWEHDGQSQPSGFSYLDEQGRWHASWPPPGEAANTPVAQQLRLPRAIRLSGPRPVVLVALQATRNPMLQRRALEATGQTP